MISQLLYQFHMKPGALFDMQRAQSFVAEGRIIMEPTDELEL